MYVKKNVSTRKNNHKRKDAASASVRKSLSITLDVTSDVLQ